MSGLGGFGATQSALLRLLLRNKSGLTVDQIAESLGVTRTAVNQHLAVLERDGYVLRTKIIATGGRPSRAFALSEKGLHLFPKNYEGFSLQMLTTLMETLGDAQTETILKRLGREMGKDLGTNLKDKPLSQRVEAITETLKALGYDAHLPKTPEKTPSISAYNCVYHKLARTKPEICNLDLALLEEASGANVDHAACMAKGDNACRFSFTEKKN